MSLPLGALLNPWPDIAEEISFSYTLQRSRTAHTTHDNFEKAFLLKNKQTNKRASQVRFLKHLNVHISIESN